MKTKLFLLITFLGMFFYSCENVQNEPTALPFDGQVMVTVIDTIDGVNADVVKHVAEYYQKNTQTRNGASKVIKEIIPVNNEEGITTMYVVNFEDNQGYIILSGSNEYQPVLAFSENGYFDINSTNGSSVWLAEQQRFIKNIKSLPDSIRQKNKRIWNRYFEKEEVVLFTSNNVQTRAVDPDLEHQAGTFIEETLNKWGDEGYQIYPYSIIQSEEIFTSEEAEQINLILANNADDRFFGGFQSTVFIRVKRNTENSSVSPLLKSKWNQDGGYNAYTPNNYYVGCGAVAVGQIMRYHEYPVLYNWGAMAYTYPTDLSARFLAEVGGKMHTKYSPEGSSSSIDEICNTLRGYGYAKSSIVNHNNSYVETQLDNKCPLFMGGFDKNGEGHAWVCDGYSSSWTNGYYEVMAIDRMTLDKQNIFEYAHMFTKTHGTGSTLYHMNWGWGGSSDGYFTENDAKGFTSQRKDITNICPSR